MPVEFDSVFADREVSSAIPPADVEFVSMQL